MKGQDIRHLDEARDRLITGLKGGWKKLNVKRILIIEDAFGRFSLGVWGPQSSMNSLKKIMMGIAPFDSGSIFSPPVSPGDFDPLELESSWEEALSIVEDDEVDVELLVDEGEKQSCKFLGVLDFWASH